MACAAPVRVCQRPDTVWSGNVPHSVWSCLKVRRSMTSVSAVVSMSAVVPMPTMPMVVAVMTMVPVSPMTAAVMAPVVDAATNGGCADDKQGSTRQNASDDSSGEHGNSVLWMIMRGAWRVLSNTGR